MIAGRHGSCARAGVAGILLAIALATAFSCASRAGTAADAGSLQSNANDGAPPLDLGDAATPCDRYFAAKYGLAQAGRFGCGPSLPAAEVVRIRARFERSCQDQLALPGSGVTDAKLKACISARGLIVDVWAVPATTCVFQGSLAGGAPCVDAVQCQSGVCVTAVGSRLAPATIGCGTCGPATAVGQPCNRAQTCTEGHGCFALTPDAAYPDFTCIPVTVGEAGAPCDDMSSQCALGLYCDPEASTCSPPADPGEACGRRPCAPSLNCWGDPPVCRQRASAGTPCDGDCQCAHGLGCFSGRCSSGTWVAPGGACSSSDPDRLCLIGTCGFSNYAPGGGPPLPSPDGGPLLGTCPRVISDGEPCDPTDALTACDTFSQCFEGRCALIDSVLCQ